jgi:hypothetical protein
MTAAEVVVPPEFDALFRTNNESHQCPTVTAVRQELPAADRLRRNWNDLQPIEYSLRIGGSEGGQIASFIIDMSTGAAELVIDCR